MPYTPTVWQDGVTLGNQTRMNNIETMYTEAVNSFEADMFTPFVLNGLTCTKDGSVANQLDVTAGVAFPKQTDNSLRRRSVAGSNPGQFTTSTINTTYYLFLNNDGTWTWSTTSTGPANSLAICQATTDGSGNILVVSDKRTFNTAILPGAAGLVGVNRLLSTQTANAYLQEIDTGTDVFDNLQAPDNGSRKRHLRANAGSNVLNDFLVGNTDGSATFPGAIKGVAGQATAGSFGVAPIVAVAKAVHVTSTTVQSILTFTPAAAGFYRMSVHITAQPGVSSALTALLGYKDGNNPGSNVFAWFTWANNPNTLLNGANSSGMPQSMACEPITFYASNAQIFFNYTSPSGTPNDFVTAVLEQLA